MASEKVQNFYKTMAIQMDYGTQVLGEIIKAKLSGKTLQEHLNNSQVKLKFKNLEPFQKQKLYPQKGSPNISNLDISLLTRILLGSFELEPIERQHIYDMRKIRNKLAHASKAELELKDNDFNKAKYHIEGLCENLDNNVKKRIRNGISELYQRQIVQCCSSKARVLILSESLMVDIEETCIDDKSHEKWIKYRITKSALAMAKYLQVDTFLQKLKSSGVVSFTFVSQINSECFNNEETVNKLVLQMAEETKQNVLQFCKCLRECNPLLADIVENKHDSGRETEMALKRIEKEQVNEILQDSVTFKTSNLLSTEDVHIFVENRLLKTIPFSVIEKCMSELFGFQTLQANENSFRDVAWKDDPFKMRESSAPPGEDKSFMLMDHEQFGLYIEKNFGAKWKPFRKGFAEAVRNEWLEPETFMTMTTDEIKIVLSKYIETIPYGFILALQKLQKEIRNGIDKTVGDAACTLRKFDTPTGNCIYQAGNVLVARGNLLVPTHRFVSMQEKDGHMKDFIVKEVIRFAVGCINAAKNGTIHFGIAENENGGTIHGISKQDNFSEDFLNTEILKGFDNCFCSEEAVFAKRCVRPIQMIPTTEKLFVLEVDIVAFSEYLKPNLVIINFPPKGKQSLVCVYYNNDHLITTGDLNGDEQCELNNLKSKVVSERRNLETEVSLQMSSEKKLGKKLAALLTKENKYVTDEFLPVICIGNLSGLPLEEQHRKDIDLSRALLSCRYVFDFDSSVLMRNSVEMEKSSFHIVMVNESSMKGDFDTNEKMWIYCNGNKELSCDAMNSKDWCRDRHGKVKKILDDCRNHIPENRACFIFMIFEELKEDDPVYEIARECLLYTFKNECIILAENDTYVKTLKQIVARRFGDNCANKYFFTNLKWPDISKIVNSVFKKESERVYKLPNSNGHYDEMTAYEKDTLKLDNIDILSGEMCIWEHENMTREDIQNNQSESQNYFYRGNQVSWWNFYFESHVGKRDLFDTYKKKVKSLLTEDSDKLNEVFTIRHHTGAGGTTVGRHLLWHFSQFHQEPEDKYRCCVVESVTDDTANQIERFRNFKDRDAKPVIVLVDNIKDDDSELLISGLKKVSYLKGVPGKLFSVIIQLCRTPISAACNEKNTNVLKHKLSQKEKMWFEEKYAHLEKTDGVIVDTLIAFNVMRHSFAPEFMEKIAQDILKDTTAMDLCVLKCLSLISSYNIDDPVPVSIFDDSIFGGFFETHKNLRFGVMKMMRERQEMNQKGQNILNIAMSNALNLLVTKRKSPDSYIDGISIISQPLARKILDHILNREKMLIKEMVYYVLKLVEKHAQMLNPQSKKFVRIVCSLFKIRQVIESEKGDKKTKFSDLVQEMANAKQEEENHDSHKDVVEAIQRCFDITKDAMVGQQLARYYIHIHKFEDAESAIELSIRQRPQSSYLLDTYGQIFKTQLEFELDEISKRDHDKIESAEVERLVGLAVKAVKTFIAGQKVAKLEESELNLSCFHMELKTIFFILEKLENKLYCFENRRDFSRFLLDKTDMNNSLKLFQKGSDIQIHMEETLRFLEENDYQVKKSMFVIYKDNDVLLLNFRERYELVYGDPSENYRFQFSLGLKPLMNAHVENETLLMKRVNVAEDNIERKGYTHADFRDLLVLLGYKIILMSSLGEEKYYDYQKLLNLSTVLLDSQRKRIERHGRPYLEGFLYHAILHWPLSTRTESHNLCAPKTFCNILEEWSEAYDQNQFIHCKDAKRKNKPKHFLALGTGEPGKDIVDLEAVRKVWRQTKKEKEGRSRQAVFSDYFWTDPSVRGYLLRLEGVVDDSGHCIKYKACYRSGTHVFKINTYYPCHAFVNRPVTFILGFSWKGPVAFDVEEKRKETHSIPDHVDGENSQPEDNEESKGKSSEHEAQRNVVDEASATGGAASQMKEHEAQRNVVDEASATGGAASQMKDTEPMSAQGQVEAPVKKKKKKKKKKR